MADHHLIKNVERGGSCIYCSEKLDDKWESSFSARKHYKCVVCKCGKSNCIEADFMGTGHDNWSELEKKVSKNSSVRIIEKNVRIL
ncbi:hypothetical protein CMO88_00615 [Candidatus Woesearchaeota archaeon]|mgnify:CR=1 FL=1|nr:hypothetical protein [Candidatus Woesearchaeota archaeon]|tara:strand:- start:13069 stop:13326 length:258 start_codon:yes stop_codon:yes gene_type:complete